jgi:hypothetical protein
MVSPSARGASSQRRRRVSSPRTPECPRTGRDLSRTP